LGVLKAVQNKVKKPTQPQLTGWS